MAHAQLSPSKRHRWGVCPGSIREEAKYPEQDSGPAAVDGTHTHTLLEQCIKLQKDASAFVGLMLTNHEGEFLVDAPRAARVQVALDYIKSRVAEFNGLCEVIAETKVNPKWFLHRDDLSGTVDVWISGPGVLEIIDYKDGMGVVEAVDNPQLEQYAIGTLAESELGWNVPEQYPWQVVRMTIVQPKLAFKGMNPISTWTATTKELLDRVSLLGQQARATDAPDAPLVPGDSQCKFCRAKGSCAALAGNVMKEVGIMFQPVMQTLDVAQQSADKDPTTMTDDQLRQIMEAAPLMRQLLDGVEKESLRRLKAGQPVPGLKLVYGRGSRAWSLPEAEMAEKLVKMGIPKGAIYETSLVSPAKAEKLTWKKKDGTDVQLTERQLKTMETEYVTKLAGKLTVVPESDSRPAVITNAAPMFSAIEAAPAAESLPSWLI
ncbi:Protein of unknown function DUF2800 [uncultured Caudovirales phage]|uniref:Uncharacterized protein n=1 Tax=uncultured Caudovirales phage TaxID=2100421 RepID=A0A6J5NMH5_9CAUD|nr:Protein of unknown function DUF2800 [uncultured Caudovirales phage]CAB4161030.1 Protein of unknown function DUF2800 [uncultured Caudovirales phage]